MSIFEAIMMLCFGASWPFQVAKTYKTKNVEGKSILFLWLVMIGYISGMVHKILNNYATDTFFYYRYKKPALSKNLTFKNID